jgi:hypothetical protein
MKNIFTPVRWLKSRGQKNYRLPIFLFAMLHFTTAFASDFIEVLPVTNKILVVYIKDGHIDSYGSGQSIADNVTYVNTTDINKIKILSNYEISSTDDPSYAIAKNPVNIGRKSKATDYNDEYQPIPYVMGHWMYIELPTALIQGKTYTVQLNNLVENKNAITFVYDLNKLMSPTVHVNMIGFPQNGVKYAYLSNWMGDFNTAVHTKGGLKLDDKAGAQFRLIKVVDGTVAFTGSIVKRMDKTFIEAASNDFAPENNYSLADVWECNFSSFTAAGEYVIAIDGIGCSYPFEINNEVTREPFYYSLKGLFWQRQGIVKEMENGKIMPRDHHYDDIIWRWDKNWPGGEDASGFNTTTASVVKGIYGYYHDAGDWDGYEVHGTVPMSLLLLYDLAPEKFYDGEVGNRYKLSAGDANWIDEGNNGLPDILDEASWLINYYKRSKDILKNNYGGTGGVPGYVGRDAIPGNNITSWQDTREWYLSAENTFQTFQYAALAAWYAASLNKFHQLTATGNHPDAAGWQAEAIAAWNWASARPLNTNEEKRRKGLAAVCLYRLTGNTIYQTAFQDFYNSPDPESGYGEWASANMFDIAISVYAMLPAAQPSLNTVLYNDVKARVLFKADGFKVNDFSANAFRNSMEENQRFELGGFTTPKMTLVPVAYKLTGDNKYLAAAQHALSYSLGGNQTNLTYLSGLGEASDIWVFNPDGWLTNNYNSKVYDNEPNIGYTTYFGAVNYWFYNSAFSEYFSKTAAYPQAKDAPNSWPESESKFFNRYSIQGGEFTVYQNNAYMIYATGFIKAMANAAATKYIPNAKPVVSLNLTDNQVFSSAGGNLTVTASPDTRSVKYYYEWHYIGESTNKTNDFSFFWKPTQTAGTNVLITAVGYDDRGRHTDPSNDGDKTVTIGAATGDTQPPTVPLALSAVNILSTTFTLNWAAATDNIGVVGYDVFKAGVLIGTATTTTFNITGLSAATTYSITLKAKDAAGNISAASSPLSVTTQGIATGKLEAENALLGGGVIIVNNANASGGKVTGYMNATGDFLQWTNVPAGTKLTVAFITPAATTKSVYINGIKVTTLNLPASVNIISLVSLNITIPANATLKIQRDAPDNNWTDFDYIDISTPVANGTGLTANYFNNKTLTSPSVLSRTEAVNFYWENAAPAPVVTADNFSVRWEGLVQAPVTGTYTFSTISDDGVRLWVNGVQVINNFTDHSVTTDVAAQTLSFTAGQQYSIKMEYYESLYNAVAKLQWAYPGQNTQPVPAARLFAVGANLKTAPATIIADNKSLKISPNPARDKINIELYSANKQGVFINISNAAGQLLQQSKHSAVAGINTILMPLKLRPGTYFISVKQSGKVQVKKLVVE